jgi:hypothetical protein
MMNYDTWDASVKLASAPVILLGGGSTLSLLQIWAAQHAYERGHTGWPILAVVATFSPFAHIAGLAACLVSRNSPSIHDSAGGVPSPIFLHRPQQRVLGILVQPLGGEPHLLDPGDPRHWIGRDEIRLSGPLAEGRERGELTVHCRWLVVFDGKKSGSVLADIDGGDTFRG